MSTVVVHTKVTNGDDVVDEQMSQEQSISNRIPEKYLPNLDPEWKEMWTNHGQAVVGAHLISVEEFRRNPAKYSFTYPTWSGTY
jgi:hypothetical protein